MVMACGQIGAEPGAGFISRAGGVFPARRDHLAADEPAAVYCAWCDEAFDATEPRCPRCGRPF